jgi:hypothetical protein
MRKARPLRAPGAKPSGALLSGEIAGLPIVFFVYTSSCSVHGAAEDGKERGHAAFVGG